MPKVKTFYIVPKLLKCQNAKTVKIVKTVSTFGYFGIVLVIHETEIKSPKSKYLKKKLRSKCEVRINYDGRN
jgi:hypothetical protein